MRTKWTKGGFSTDAVKNSCSVRGLSIVVGCYVYSFVSYGNQPFQNTYSSCLVERDIELHDE